MPATETGSETLSYLFLLESAHALKQCLHASAINPKKRNGVVRRIVIQNQWQATRSESIAKIGTAELRARRLVCIVVVFFDNFAKLTRCGQREGNRLCKREDNEDLELDLHRQEHLLEQSPNGPCRSFCRHIKDHYN